MLQIWIPRFGDPGVLEVREAADPSPGPGEALVAVRAIGVNFADIMARMGLYPEAPRVPFVPGYEFSGTVLRTGVGVPLAAGARVMGIVRFGAYSTLVTAPHTWLWPLPDAMSFEEAAALPVSYLTASLAVHRFGNLRPGETVLVRSAAGGLGLAAVQLAGIAGARVLGTASVPKHDRLRRVGVDVALDSASDIRAAVLEATGGRGVDLAVNSTGGSTVRTDMDLLAPLGRIVLCGISTAAAGRRRSLLRLIELAVRTPRPLLFGLMNTNRGVFGLNLGRLWSETDRLRLDLGGVVRLYETGALRPVIARTFGFRQAADAHRYIQDRKNFGKVLLGVDQAS